MMQSSEQDVGECFPHIIRIPLDVRQQRVDVHQRLCLQAGWVGHVVAFECIDEKQCI
ncbi:hypothetical protein SAMN04487948_11117 [Halogranum amylolyticum]|uniref:Uncharacterized protein n=1 Tax=Halogranum amylolyticum TaxID=660520 RepID=A0A1H8UHB7_9EURY|nr:hypothetical protein SAMN04487948_11117 [Halogranum amylolyticum]